MAGRGGEELQRLAQRVQLELPVDPVADLVRAARVAGQVRERALLPGTGPRDTVYAGFSGAVGQHALGHEGDGIVQQAVRAVGGTA